MSEKRLYLQSSATEWTSRPTDSEIACRAYNLWMAAGCPQGRDVECWLEAETQLSSMWRLAERVSSGRPLTNDPRPLDLVSPAPACRPA